MSQAIDEHKQAASGVVVLLIHLLQSWSMNKITKGFHSVCNDVSGGSYQEEWRKMQEKDKSHKIDLALLSTERNNAFDKIYQSIMLLCNVTISSQNAVIIYFLHKEWCLFFSFLSWLQDERMFPNPHYPLWHLFAITLLKWLMLIGIIGLVINSNQCDFLNRFCQSRWRYS